MIPRGNFEELCLLVHVFASKHVCSLFHSFAKICHVKCMFSVLLIC